MDSTIHLKKIRNLYVVGGFDGDGKIDTVFEHIFSKALNIQLDSIPDPFLNSWETEEYWYYNWFNKYEPTVYLTFNKKGHDTLHLGEGWGFYCLFTIGDINSDGKDEIALVLNYCDFSNLNRCEIYSYCKNKWTKLKEFNIHEGAFEFTVDTIPIFSEISGYIEKQKDKWVYADFDDAMLNVNGEGKMVPLKLNKCN